MSAVSRVHVFIVFLFSLQLSHVVGAEEKGVVSTYLVPSVSYNFLDGGRGADDGFGLKLGAGLEISPGLSGEFSLYGAVYSGDNGDLKEGGWLFDGVYIYNQREKLSRFVVAGLGLQQSKDDIVSVTNVIANVGWGTLYRYHETVSVRADIRYRLENSAESSVNDWLVNIGVIVPMGD